MLNSFKKINYFKLLSAISYKKKYPLFITWTITKRCNRYCQYCVGNIDGQEIDTKQIFEIIDQAYNVGTRFISFTGGEPLLREDIKEIIDYAKGKGIFVKLNTNGLILKEKIGEIKNVDLIHLSIDAQEYVNDFIKGELSFIKALEGLKAARENGIKVSLKTVISKKNVNYLKEVIDISIRHNVSVSFQPATLNIYGTKELNPVSPEINEYRKVIKEIIQFKRNRLMQRLIINSRSGLKHLLNWPNPSCISCYAGITSFRIDNNGKVYNCNEYKERGIDILENGFKKSIEILKYSPCQECWGSNRVEFNLIMSLNLDSLINTVFNH